MLLNTFVTTETASGKPPGYVDPANGSCSPLHVFLGEFHSFPLHNINIDI